MKYFLVVGARPNFIKAFPCFLEMLKNDLDVFLINTGQHYSDNMSNVFFREFKINDRILNLNSIGITHAEQTADIMIKCERLFSTNKPDIVVVFGDVNSTLSASIAAKKMNINLVHVEAGLRSFDRTMPEELNRLLVDSISDFYFTTCLDGSQNLINESVPNEKIFMIGNTMLDSFVMFKDEISKSDIINKLDLVQNKYLLVTLHRKSNIDNLDIFLKLVDKLNTISKSIRLIWPVHPGTRKTLSKHFSNLSANIILSEPLGYIDFMSLLVNCKIVVTDSGGIQEESCFLRKPCITLRANTERPVTLSSGSNVLCNPPFDSLLTLYNAISKKSFRDFTIPPLWDGYSAPRFVKHLMTF